MSNSVERGDQLENRIIKASFTCRACGHHRTVMALIKSRFLANIVDFKTGTDYQQKGTTYTIVIEPPLTMQSDIIYHIADGHAQIFHPGMTPEVVDIRN